MAERKDLSFKLEIQSYLTKLSRSSFWLLVKIA